MACNTGLTPPAAAKDLPDFADKISMRPRQGGQGDKDTDVTQLNGKHSLAAAPVPALRHMDVNPNHILHEWRHGNPIVVAFSIFGDCARHNAPNEFPLRRCDDI